MLNEVKHLQNPSDPKCCEKTSDRVVKKVVWVFHFVQHDNL